MNHAPLSTRLLKTNSYPKSCNTIQFNCALIKRINHPRVIIREGGVWSITISNTFCCLCLLIANQHRADNIYFCLSTCVTAYLLLHFFSCLSSKLFDTSLSDISLSVCLSPSPVVFLSIILSHVYLISPCLSGYLLVHWPTFVSHSISWPSVPQPLVSLSICLYPYHFVIIFVWRDVVILVS